MHTTERIKDLEERIERARRGRDRIDLMLDLSFELRTHDHQRAGELARQALTRARGIGYTFGIAVAQIRCADCDRLVGQLQSALRYLGRAEPMLVDDPRGAALLPHLYRTRGAIQFAMGEPIESIESLQRALLHYRNRNDQPNIATTLAFMGDACRVIGDFPRSLAALEECLRIGEELDAPGWIALALANLSCVYGDLGDTELGLEHARRSAELAHRTGNRNSEASSLAIIAVFHFRRKELAEARAYFEEARRLYDELGARGDAALYAAEIATIDIAMGNRDGKMLVIDDAIAVVRGMRDNVLLAEALGAKGAALITLDCAEQAIESIEEAIALDEANGSSQALLNRLELMTAACGQLKDDSSALRHLLRMRSIEQSIEKQQAWRRLAQIEVRKRLQLLEEQQLSADRRASELAIELRRREAEIASISLRLSQREDLIRKLRGDVAHYDQGEKGGAADLARMLRERLMRSGDENGVGWQAFEERFTTLQSGFFRELSDRCSLLTPVELKICGYIRVGLANKEIATLTCSSIHTINTHRRNIRRKLRLEAGSNLDTMLARFPS